VKHVVFYSWQSDLDAALTRNFIEDALGRAVKNIRRDEELSLEPVIDRDTAGVMGAPGISETIFQKIDSCDVFVCDVSTINKPAVQVRLSVVAQFLFNWMPKRATPNPNVTLELGYAAARIGWEHMILVKNTAFAGIEDLPFDLRGRRLVPFSLSSRIARTSERTSLRDSLEAALRSALADMIVPKTFAGKTTPRWFGFWHTRPEPMRGSTLLVREVGATGFMFHLNLHDGARTGEVGGFAKFTGPDAAYAQIGAGSDTPPCELKFRRSLEGIRQLTLEESPGCHQFKGVGARFEGVYICAADLLFDSGKLDELDLQRLYNITGQYFQPLVDRFQTIGEEECIDKLYQARVVVGGAKGLFLDFAAIVMRGEYGQLWAAYIDGDDVRYFTTEPHYRRRLPATIEQWRANVKNRPVIYADDVRCIPQR